MTEETNDGDSAERWLRKNPIEINEAIRRGRGEVSEYDRVRRELAAATRRITNELVATTAPHEQIAEAAALVERAAAVLASGPHGRPYEGPAEGSISGGGGFVDHSPIIGLMNPLAPPMTLTVLEDEVVGTVTYGLAYEGPPGHLHGGLIAAGFDEVLGFTQSLTGKPGMTGRLTITYRSPTPLHREVRYVGRVTGVDGRKILTHATLSVGDTLCAEAEGLFISMKPEVFEGFLASRWANGT
jgi:acyl-coenzyme A thioesterase PaaI-like protein